MHLLRTTNVILLLILIIGSIFIIFPYEDVSINKFYLKIGGINPNKYSSREFPISYIYLKRIVDFFEFDRDLLKNPPQILVRNISDGYPKNVYAFYISQNKTIYIILQNDYNMFFIQTEPNTLERILYHEVFHYIQDYYCSLSGNTSVSTTWLEGTADAVAFFFTRNEGNIIFTGDSMYTDVYLYILNNEPRTFISMIKGCRDIDVSSYETKVKGKSLKNSYNEVLKIIKE